MEVLFILFTLVSTSVLGLLCLLVLEYQNGKARRWNRLWSDRRASHLTHPTPIVPGEKTTPVVEPSSRSLAHKSP